MKRKMPWWLLGAAFLLVAAQAALGPSLAAWLRRDLARQAGEYRTLDVRVGFISWLDLLRGRLRRVDITADEITFGGPRLARLEMNLKNLRFALWPLLTSGEAVLEELGESGVLARIEAAALNAYRRNAYPLVPVIIQIKPELVELTGSLNLLGREIGIRTEGGMRAEEGTYIRYVPTLIEVGGRSVSAEWLSMYGQEVSMRFPVVLPLPVVLEEVGLGEGYAELRWREAGREGAEEAVS